MLARAQRSTICILPVCRILLFYGDLYNWIGVYGNFIVCDLNCVACKDYYGFRFYRDASFGTASFYLTLLDVFNGLYRAFQHKFFDFDDFDVDEYEYYEVSSSHFYNRQGEMVVSCNDAENIVIAES